MNMKNNFAAAILALPIMAGLAACDSRFIPAAEKPPKDMDVRVEQLNGPKLTYGANVPTYQRLIVKGKVFNRAHDVPCLKTVEPNGQASTVCDFAAGGPVVGP